MKWDGDELCECELEESLDVEIEADLDKLGWMEIPFVCLNAVDCKEAG
jgi:hypothetical protein